jgi:hypothetical protein
LIPLYYTYITLYILRRYLKKWTRSQQFVPEETI